MTAGDKLTRAQRLEMIRLAEERRGLPPSRKAYELDLGGAVYAGGSELDLEPTWFDMPGSAGTDSSRRAGNVKRWGTGNSAAFALIESFARAYREPPLYVWAGPYMDIGASERLSDHPLCQAQGLLRKPCPGANITMGALRAAIAKAKIVAGNYYLVKARTGGGDVLSNTTGAVARLWPVWPTQMWPATYAKSDPRQSNGWTDYYAYETGRGQPLEVPVENVIHFRNGVNPRNPRIGIGVVEEFAMEVTTDSEAALLVQAVMSNLGVPGLVFAPDAAGGAVTGIGKDDRETIKAALMAKTTGNRRGEPIVLSRPTSLQQFQVNLDVLNLDYVWTHVESRISAVIGWPAILAGLQAGLENATYSNAQSLKRFATENAAIPTWVDDSEVWTDELAGEFGLGREEYIAYDYLSVRALQEDENERWKRVGEAFARNEITLGQHHQMLGLDLPDGVDPSRRFADFQGGGGAGQLGALLGGPRKGGGVLGGVPKFTTRDLPLTAAELDEGELTEQDVHEALVRMAERLEEVDPELAGILGAEDEKPDDGEEGEKRLPFQATKADPRKRTWTWDPNSERYRWPHTGRLVPEGRVFRARERLIEDSQKRMAGLADRYTSGEITLSQWQKQMRREYTDQHVAMRALGRGGEKQLTRADRQAISDMVKRENEYLAGFARDIADGQLTPDQIRARAQMYAGANMRQEYAAGRLAAHQGAGYTHKKRLGPNDSRTCPTCRSEIAQEWVPIDAAGFVLGATECGSRDRCEIVFSRELPGGGREY